MGRFSGDNCRNMDGGCEILEVDEISVNEFRFLPKYWGARSLLQPPPPKWQMRASCRGHSCRSSVLTLALLCALGGFLVSAAFCSCFLIVTVGLLSSLRMNIHPKTLFEITVALLTIRVSFPSKSRFSATFSILLRFGESWNPTNCQKFNADGSLMGRTNLHKSVW